MDEDKNKESFEAQKKETKKIVPNIQDTFLTYTVKAFSFTFKVSAIILLPGILFALFSDKKRNSYIKNKQFIKKYSELVIKVNSIINEKNITGNDLPEVSKWINNEFDFNLRSIVALEIELNEDLIKIIK